MTAPTRTPTAPHPLITPQPGILDIAPYVGGESAIPGANRVLKLSSNENPHGPSPHAREAFAACADRLAIYPDGGHAALRRAIGEVHGVDPARILCGNGSDEMLSLIAQAYAGPGDEVVHSAHGFALYRINALAVGATPVAAAEPALVTDVDAVLAACTDRTRLVFVANPNNPTGTLIGAEGLARLADAIPRRALLVIDGAYEEYVRGPARGAGLALALSRDNVVVTRTFSKIHGLAGLRIGWMVGPDHVIDAIGRFRPPFNVSIPALAAAEAAMRDTDYVEGCAVFNEAWRDWLAKRLEAVGLPCLPSEGNFLLVEFGTGRAEAADAFLKARGIIVRRTASYALPGHLRITVGDEAACREVAEAAADFAGRG